MDNTTLQPFNNYSGFNFTHDETGIPPSDMDYYNINFRIKSVLEKPHGIIALVFGFISILLNIIILLCLYKVHNRLTSHCRLIISLAVADLVVGASVLFHIVNRTFNPLYPMSASWNQRLYSTCVYLFIKAMNTTGLNVTLLNLMAMAVDHYIAILKPLQYPVIMTRARVIVIIIVIWIIALLLGFSDFLVSCFSYYDSTVSSLPNGLLLNYCEVVSSTNYHEEFTVFANAPLCLSVMIFVYMRIYIKVLHHRRPGVDSQSTQTQRETQRKTKALVTTLLNIGTFIVAWLPLCLCEISLLVIVKTNPQYLATPRVQKTFVLINQHLFNMLIFNAIADPIIYTVRMREVRVGFARLCGYCCKHKRAAAAAHSAGAVSSQIRLLRKSSSSASDRERAVKWLMTRNTSVERPTRSE